MNVKDWFQSSSLGRPRFDRLMSQCVTQAQMDSPRYRQWCETELCQPFVYHRKDWEWAYIAEAIRQAGLLEEGRRGLGFGVGIEPLVAILARHGLEILATDQDPTQASGEGWEFGKNYGGNLEWLNRNGLLAPEVFERLVSFRIVDMNQIPVDLRDFDFCWSSCALEHLGSIAAGFRFIENSLKCVKPGGIVVHTTEFNVSSNDHTVEEGATVFYRRKDLESFVRYMRLQGFRMRVNYFTGNEPKDTTNDQPPYGNESHLKLQVGAYVITSVGLIIKKPK